MEIKFEIDEERVGSDSTLTAVFEDSIIDENRKPFNPNLFYSFGRKRIDVKTIIFNLFFLILFIAVEVINFNLTLNKDKVYFQLTTISYFVQILYLIAALIFEISAPISRASCTWKFNRILHVIAYTSQGAIFIAYWAAIAPLTIPEYPNTCRSVTWCYVHTITVHGISAIPSWSVIFCQLSDVYWSDVAWPLLYLFLYVFAILVPVTLSHVQLYPGLDFFNYWSYLYVLAGSLMGVLVFFVGCWISSCKSKRYKQVK